ncbi:MAG: hypothetical protein ACJAT4_001435 [Granulosicoccus sp.]|jgi:hypothetical protein
MNCVMQEDFRFGLGCEKANEKANEKLVEKFP